MVSPSHSPSKLLSMQHRVCVGCVPPTMSQFHQEKWPTCPRRASPVGEPLDATIVPWPSWIHTPVVSSSDQSGKASPSTTGEPSSASPA